MQQNLPVGRFHALTEPTEVAVRAVAKLLEGTWFGGFFGEPAKVAESLERLAEIGIERAQVSPFGDESFPSLAEHLPLGC